MAGVLFLPVTAFAAQDNLKEARAAFDRKDYEAAVRLLNTVNADAGGPLYELRAIAQAYRGHPEEALADLDHLEGKAPAHILRRISLGLLTHLLSHEQDMVRGAAAAALAEFGPSGAQEALTKGLADPSPRVRLEALRVLPRLGKDAFLYSALCIMDDPMDLTLEYALRLTVRELTHPWLTELRMTSGTSVRI